MDMETLRILVRDVVAGALFVRAVGDLPIEPTDMVDTIQRVGTLARFSYRFADAFMAARRPSEVPR